MARLPVNPALVDDLIDRVRRRFEADDGSVSAAEAVILTDLEAVRDHLVAAEQRELGEWIRDIVLSDDCVMVNRNQGSGTRILVDELLGGKQPRGYPVQSRSHNAVVASVAQGRSDWGMAIEIAARQGGLGFLPFRHEQFDFVVSRHSTNAAVTAFRDLLERSDVRARLADLGLS